MAGRLLVLMCALLAGCTNAPIAIGVWVQFENPTNNFAYQWYFGPKDERFAMRDAERWQPVTKSAEE